MSDDEHKNCNDLSCISAAWASSEKNGVNMEYLESLYETYLDDPQSLDPSWQEYFSKLNPSDTDTHHSQINKEFEYLAQHPRATATSTGSLNQKHAHKHTAVMDLIYAYRSLGHQQAKLDPLNMQHRPPTTSLNLGFHGLSDADLETEFNIHDMNKDLNSDLSNGKKVKLKKIISDLESIYCQSIGSEYIHITDHEQREWLKNKLEVEQVTKDFRLDNNKKLWLLQRLTAADGLEKYLGSRYVGQKRFSLEGCDSLVALLDELIINASDFGAQEIVMGMAHRGRLNTLVNIVGKSPEKLFEEFEGKKDIELLSGDVKYHNGFSSDVLVNEKLMHLALAFNPSHLEIVSPVLEGSVRARQENLNKENPKNDVIAIHMHGDSAISGQGVVMETLNMSQTKGYGTGGSIHIVVNNQIGFTTSQSIDIRSTFYCTDIAKMIEAPIFHVNANDPEAVITVAKLAVEYRMKFNRDVFIDLIGFRLHGHNEADEPSATQPLMYATVKKMKPAREIYAQKLIDEGLITKDTSNKLFKEYKALLEHGEPVVSLASPNDKRLKAKKKGSANWKKYLGKKWEEEYPSKISLAKLRSITKKLEALPDGFTMQKQVGKTYEDRKKMTKGELPINWGYAEILAYATLADKGINIRISGEDCQRGTFAHRHSVLHDYNNGDLYTPLENLGDKQGRIEIINSLLSEEAVVAFEYGYTTATPEDLVIWEAQFGDFANGAQVIFDQFLSSGEEKWGRLCNLCLFLPHGQEGMGAEHSSARLERFLQLCAHNNMQVCVPSTPSQVYHMIRRQMLRKYRKPLVVMTPKSLLRHPLAVSDLKDLTDGTFDLVIDEIDNLAKNKVSRLILCSGKVYYDLLAARREKNIKNIAIVRVEQLYPFPEKSLKALIKKYPNAKEIIWTQEEPQNQGAFLMIQDNLQDCMPKNIKIQLISRERFAAPAPGYPSLHRKQQQKIIDQTLKFKAKK